MIKQKKRYAFKAYDNRKEEQVMATIQIITDAGADLTKKEQEAYGIDVIPIRITADETEYLSGVDMFSDEFYALLEKSAEIPRTSQPTTQEIYDIFRRHIDAGKEILAISLSADASGIHNNMHLAKSMILEETPGAVIEIVNSGRFAYIYGKASILASKLAEDGCEMDEIIKKVNAFMDGYGVFAIPQSLVYLEKGGRINKASLIFGNMLDISPVLTIQNGLMEAVGKVRGRKKLAKKMVQYLKEHAPDQTGKHLIVVHGKMEEETEELKTLLLETYPDATLETAKVGPTIATHIGPVFAVFYEK